MGSIPIRLRQYLSWRGSGFRGCADVVLAAVYAGKTESRVAGGRSMGSSELDRLRALLIRLAAAESRLTLPGIKLLEHDFRDCWLQIIQEGIELSEEQRRVLDQIGQRLEGIRDGQLSAWVIPSLAEQALAAFGWDTGE